MQIIVAGALHIENAGIQNIDRAGVGETGIRRINEQGFAAREVKHAGSSVGFEAGQVNARVVVSNRRCTGIQRDIGGIGHNINGDFQSAGQEICAAGQCPGAAAQVGELAAAIEIGLDGHLSNLQV